MLHGGLLTSSILFDQVIPKQRGSDVFGRTNRSSWLINTANRRLCAAKVQMANEPPPSAMLDKR